MEPAPFEIPSLRALARHAAPHLIESTLIPLVLFYTALSLIGIGAALGTAIVWSYGAVLRRVMRRQRLPGLLVLGALGLTVRTLTVLSTGSVFIYFLQPSLTTIVVAMVFLASVAAHRPLAERLARDFCPMPDAFVRHPAIRRLFGRITLLWAFIQLANAGMAIWLLVNQSVGGYLVSRTALSWVLTAGGIALSTVHFKRTLRRHGFAWRTVPVDR